MKASDFDFILKNKELVGSYIKKINKDIDWNSISKYQKFTGAFMKNTKIPSGIENIINEPNTGLE